MLMKKIFFIAIMALVVSQAKADEIGKYSVEVGQFDKVKVCDNVNVVYRCLPDSTGYVQYSGDRQFADAFIISPKDGTLKIQVSTEDVGHPDLPVLYIYSDFLTSVENSSNFSFMIEDPAPCAEFKATQIGNGSLTIENLKTNKLSAAIKTGNGSVTVSGKCQEAQYKMLGTGMIAADRMESVSVNCRIMGSGSIGCWPEKLLTVKGLGSTKIYYKGDPKIKKSGGGKLFPLPEGRPLDTVVEKEEGVEKDADVEEDLEEDAITVVEE